MKIKEYFRQKGKKVIYKKGEIIISPSEKPRGIFIINSGYLFSRHVSRDNRRKIQMIFKPGELFPLIWGLKDIQKEYYYQALTNVSLYMISKEDLVHAIDAWPQFSIGIIGILASYLDTYVNRLENLEAKNIEEKLLKRLFFLGKRFGKKHDSNITLDFPITHSLISESISISRENVTRILNRLEKDKVISFKNHKLTILDQKTLKKKLLL